MGMNASRSRLTSTALVLLCGAVAALLPRAASADDGLTHPELREFFRTGKYVMYISGEVQSKAPVYHSRRAGAFLVTDTSYGKPLLIQPREQIISTVKADEIAVRPDKGVDLVAGATVTKLGDIKIDRNGMAIRVEGLVARLAPQPHLLGKKDAEEVLLHSPEYGRAGASYRPSEADIRRIKAVDREIEVVVYFGTWCPTCRRLLPRILKVDEAIQGSKVTISYYGLAKGRSSSEIQRYGIKRVPTGVIMVNGRAAGQISGTSFSRPERAIASALGS